MVHPCISGFQSRALFFSTEIYKKTVFFEAGPYDLLSTYGLDGYRKSPFSTQTNLFKVMTGSQQRFLLAKENLCFLFRALTAVGLFTTTAFSKFTGENRPVNLPRQEEKNHETLT